MIPVVAGIAAAGAAAAGTAGIGILGGSALFGLTTVGGLIGFGISVAGSVATSLLGSTSASRRDLSSGLQQATVTEAARARFRLLGERLTGGQLVFQETTGLSGAGDLWRVIVTDCQPSEAVLATFVNGEEVTLNASGVVTAPAKWAGQIIIYNRFGDINQTVLPELKAAFQTWTDDHRLRGLSYMVVVQKPVGIASVQDVYPNGPRGEQITQKRRGAKDVYDPRTGQSGWSRNGALGLLWEMRNPLTGNLPLDDFSLASWAAAATICDEVIVNGNGNAQARYTLSGMTSAAAPGSGAREFATKVERMLQALDAVIYENPQDGGRLAIRIGARIDPDEVLTFGPAQIISMEDQEGPGLLAGVDGVRVQYVEPELGDTETITPAFGRKADGSYGFFGVDESTSLNVQTLDLPEIDSWNHACRASARAYRRIMSERSTRASVGLGGILAHVGSDVRFALPGVPDGYLARVTGRTIDLSAGAAAAIEITAEAIHPDHEADPACPPLVVPPLTNTNGATIPAPAGLRSGATAGGRVRVAWNIPTGANVVAQIEWAETGSGVFGNRETEASALGGSREINTSTATGNVDLRVRFGLGSADFTAFTTITNIDRTAPLAAPAAPALRGPSVGEAGDAIGYQITAASAGDILRVELLRNGAVVQTKAVDTVGPHTLSFSGPEAEYTVTARTINVSGLLSPVSPPITLVMNARERGGGGRD